MSTNWLKLERALGRADNRLSRRIVAQVWLIRFHHYKRHMHLKTGRSWSVEVLNNGDCPVWYDRTKLRLVYDDVALLALEAKVLVLRLRALKYHGSVDYLDPAYTKLPSVLDYDLHPDL